MRRLALPALLLALLFPSLSPASAASTKSFHQATAKDFEEGEAEGSMILPSGEVVPGMRSSHIAVEAAFVWCSALSRDGAVAYFGTGDEGKIFAVDTKGGGEHARRVADLDAAWVTALAVRPDGTLLAGTTPGGRLFTVDPKSGASHELARLPADHIWSLVYDDKRGVAYAGSGAPGKIFAIDEKGGKGHVREVWDSRDKHIVSLLQADDRHLLAGTSEEGILYRVSLDGRAEALQDFEAEEVRALARSGDALLVAVNDFERSSGSTPAGPPPAKGTRITIAPSGSPASAGALPRPGQRKSRAALYRLERDGRIEQVFAIPDGYFTALLVDGQDALVATGSRGRVYRVRPDRTASLAIDLPERQALTLMQAGGTFLVGTGDVGGVYRARPAATGEATYLSRVLDADFPARWGLLRWHGAQALGVATRSGNTAKPDGSWSAFQPLDGVHATAQGGTGRVQSPPARYVQYRATLGGGEAESHLNEVTLFYLPQNQRARVTELTVPDSPAAGPAAPGAAPAARAHSSVLKLRWKVENPDGDELVYRLSFRAENEAVWRPLGGPEPLGKPEFDWNTDGLPDGSYVVRIVTSDERAQPRERALESTFLSPPLLVDNRKPEVLGLVARYPFVSGRARDGESPITALEYAVDGGEWRELQPADGLCDDVVEAFTLKLPPLAPGPHAVTVRAWDSSDNVGAAGVTVRAP
jgi:hypothetical protein